jgi:hypothetical protein
MVVMMETEREIASFKGFDGKGWICDECCQIIEKAADGWVEWLETPVPGTEHEYKGSGLRLVHHVPVSPRRKDREMGCQYNGNAEFRKNGAQVSDLSLTDFVGADGLMNLLEMIQAEKVPKKHALEMIKRLHIPGYEHTRQYFDEAIGEGVYEPNRTEGYPFQYQIESIKTWQKDRD